MNMKKLFITSLSAVVIMASAGAANAAPNHGNHNNNHRNPGRPTVTVRTYAPKNQARHYNNNKGHYQKVQVVHKSGKHCHSSCNHHSGHGSLIGAAAVGAALTGVVLYALAK